MLHPAYHRAIRTWREYPGAFVQKEYEHKCPDCKKWTVEIGDVSEIVDGMDAYLCASCSEEVIANTPEFQWGHKRNDT